MYAQIDIYFIQQTDSASKSFKKVLFLRPLCLSLFYTETQDWLDGAFV